MIRTAAAFAFLIIFLILSLPYLGIEYLAAKKDPVKAGDRQRAVVRSLLRILCRICGAGTEVTGLDSLPEGPVLFVGNHRSLFDFIAVFPLFSDRRLHFIGKQEYRRFPVFRVWFERIGSYFMDRKDARQALKVMLSAMEDIKKGESVWIFPEGTRNRAPGEVPLLPFHEGSFKVAKKTGCPIVPVAIHKAADLFEKQYPAVRPGTIRIKFLSAVRPEEIPEAYSRNTADYISGLISEELIRMEKGDKE